MHYVSSFLLGMGVLLWGSTILFSCNNPHTTRMDELARFGLEVDTHQRDRNGANALHMAIWRGDTAVVETLLNQIPEADRVALMHQRDYDGQTVLHVAAIRGPEAVVCTLLNRGADIHQRINYGDTALHIAVLSGHEGVVRLLLYRGADIYQRNNSGNTALY